MKKETNMFKYLLFLGVTLIAWILWDSEAFAQASLPTISLNLSESDEPDSVVPAVKIVGMLTILSIAPAILLMMTSFSRILIVLSFLRQAMGTASMPPNQVLIGLSLFLTFFTMKPVIDKGYDEAWKPFVEKKISHEKAIDNIAKPLRDFMVQQTREADLSLFMDIAGEKVPEQISDLSFSTLLPAFMISELKTAFQIGFLIFIPFLIIDMVISSILMAMGMMMLPPTIVSLPFKLVLFILIDGWSLIVESLVRSFNLV